MSTLPQEESPAFYWIDDQLQQQGPESRETVIERIAYQQIPDTTPVWWQGAAGWTAFNANPDLVERLQRRLAPAPAPAPTPAPAPQPVWEQAAAEPAWEPPITPAPQPEEAAYSPDPAMFATTVPAPDIQFETPNVAVAPAVASDAVAQPAADIAVEPAAPSEPLFSSPFQADDHAPTQHYSAPVTEHVASNGTVATEWAAPPWQAEPVDHGTTEAAGADEVPVVVVPDQGESTTHSNAIHFGDPQELRSTFETLQSRYAAHAAEAARATRLDDALSESIARAATSLGYTVDTHALTDTHHSLTLAAPDGTHAAITLGRVSPTAKFDDALDSPVTLEISSASVATAGLFLRDYVGAHDELDNNLLTSHFAAVAHAASQP